jgi:aspartate aminotransferase
MPISKLVKEAFSSSSLIRKMFEEGVLLKKQYGNDNVYDFSLGNPDLDPPPSFKQELLRLAEKNEKGSYGEAPDGGYPEFRKALARKISREQGLAIDASDVIASFGAGGALNAVFKSITNPGYDIIISRPYFVDYKSYINNHGGYALEIDTLSDFNLDIGQIEAVLSKNTAAILINSPNNPTGRVYPKDTIEQLGVVLRNFGDKTGCYPYLIVDEPYREIVFNNIEIPSIFSAYSESIVVSSFSKNLSLAGERIGYIVLNPNIKNKEELIDAIIFSNRILGNMNGPALMQRILSKLIEEKIDISVYAKRRNLFTQILDDVGIFYAKPEGTFYLFCKVPLRAAGDPGERDFDDRAFVDHLKKYRILGVPGIGFGKAGWVRFAYCVNEEVIIRSAESFKQVMDTW